MRKTIHVLAAAIFVFAAAGMSYAADEAVKPSVELGKKLFSDTGLGTNGRSCATCHADEAKIGEYAARGTWFGGQATTLGQAVNTCIAGGLKGTPKAEDGVEIQSIVMYMKSVAPKK